MGENIYAPLCGELYKEEDDSLFPWSGTDPDPKMKCFTCYKEDTYWISPEDHYNKYFKNWQGPIHNGQFRLKNLKGKRNIEDTCAKYSGPTKFNDILRERNP